MVIDLRKPLVTAEGEHVIATKSIDPAAARYILYRSRASSDGLAGEIHRYTANRREWIDADVTNVNLESNLLSKAVGDVHERGSAPGRFRIGAGFDHVDLGVLSAYGHIEHADAKRAQNETVKSLPE